MTMCIYLLLFWHCLLFKNDAKSAEINCRHDSVNRFPKVHPCTLGRWMYRRFGTVLNSKYKVPPSASPKLPLVASSRRQLLIFAKRYGQGKKKDK